MDKKEIRKHIKISRLYISNLEFNIVESGKMISSVANISGQIMSSSKNESSLSKLKLVRNYEFGIKNYSFSATVNLLIEVDDEYERKLNLSVDNEVTDEIQNLIDAMSGVMDDKISVYAGLLSAEAGNKYFVFPHFKETRTEITESED